MENQNNLALQNQEIAGHKQQNVFFEYVKNTLSEMEDTQLITKIHEEDFEILGMLCFITGIDYTGMAWKQNKILENVHKRFEEAQISETVQKEFVNQIQSMKGIRVSERYAQTIEDNKNCVLKPIVVSADNKLVFNQIFANIKTILNKLIIPVAFANSLVELKQGTLTYEHLFKFNSIVNQNSSYRGGIYKKLSELYGNEIFNQMLKDMMNKYDLAKYTFIYEEAIQSCIDSVNRFDFGFEAISEEAEKEMKKLFDEKEKERLQDAEEEEEQEQSKWEKKSYSEEQSKDIMNNKPDLFILTILEEQIQKNIDESNILEAIDILLDKDDFVQYVYTYLAANMKHANRNFANEKYVKFVEILDSKIKEYGAEYKQFAEINCKELDENQKNRIITYVNDCIESCIMSNEEQKQYLISQLIENGISTYNHLQQIMSIIETCTIFGEDASTYVNLYNYIQDKTNIKEVFDNGNKMMKIELKLQLYTIFKNWFNINFIPNEQG